MNWKEWAQDEQGAYVSAGMCVRPVGGKNLVVGSDSSGLRVKFYYDVHEVSYSDGEGYIGLATAKSEAEANEALASAVLDVAKQHERRALHLRKLAYKVSPLPEPESDND